MGHPFSGRYSRDSGEGQGLCWARPDLGIAAPAHKGEILSSPPELNQEQLVAARASAWKQDGEPLLTMEAARDWINERGLVLFAPSAQLGAPAPSLVEATLGASNPTPTAAETGTARGLLGRLVGEGLALPLNLLGGGPQGQASDGPDFVVSAQVFSYVFTMRGDKLWKQPPSTSGAVKVSPLGLRVYEVLTERGGMTAAELATELGREVTETAILRALSELWGQLRVIPLLSQREVAATLWELTTRRFTKAIKAGANAGLPTALSALVSLYLAQVFAATEEEVVTFLSPLTARSRVREVLHALLGARQLETIAVEGRTLLHIPGTLPEAAQVAAEAVDESAGGEGIALVAAAERPKKVGTGRIRSFEGERKPGSEFRGKPVRSFGAGAGRPGGSAGRSAARSGARADGKSDRERRPFKKDGAGAARPSFAKRSDAAGPVDSAKRSNFAKPWNEDRKPRPAQAAAAAADSFTKFRQPAAADREPLGPREQAGLPPERRSGPPPRAERGTFDRASKPGGFAKRPYTPRAAAGGDRPAAKRAYAPRAKEAGEAGSFKPRTYERAGEPGAFKPRSYERAGGSSVGRARPGERGAKSGERGTRSGERGAGPGGFGAKRPYTPRTAEGSERSFAKPKFDRDSKPGGFAKRPYTPRAGAGGESSFAKRASASGPAEGGERTLPKRPYKPRAADADKRPFTKAPWTPKEDGEGSAGKRPYKPRAAGGFGGGAGARKSFGGKPAGKFGGGAKFGGRPGAKFAGKPGAGRPAGKFGGKAGGFGGAKRAAPMGGARPPARRKPEAEERG
jgi:23S rRNA pseudouridine2605 synthase